MVLPRYCIKKHGNTMMLFSFLLLLLTTSSTGNVAPNNFITIKEIANPKLNLSFTQCHVAPNLYY